MPPRRRPLAPSWSPPRPQTVNLKGWHVSKWVEERAKPLQLNMICGSMRAFQALQQRLHNAFSRQWVHTQARSLTCSSPPAVDLRTVMRSVRFSASSKSVGGWV